jgi:hypothetical protein
MLVFGISIVFLVEIGSNRATLDQSLVQECY